MNEFQQQILQKIEQIALKLENYKNSNQQLTRTKEELEAKVNYLEKREQELKDQLENQQIELSEKSELIDKATSKIEDLLGSIDIDAPCAGSLALLVLACAENSCLMFLCRNIGYMKWLKNRCLCVV